MDQVRIGVIGVTGRGALAKNLHNPAGRSLLAGGMDTSEAALETFREEVGPDVFTTKNVDELLGRDDIDAVMVTSPDFTHEEYAVKAFEAGKHVFTEKPMAITTEGCDRMLDAWQKSGKQFMVGFNMRYMNIFRAMKEVADSGMIGEIKVVWVRHFVGTGGNWYYHDWHGTRANATSLLLQKASHDIDMIHWITGRYTKQVSAFGSLQYYGGDKPNDLICPECDERDTCVEFQDCLNTKNSNRMNMCVFRKEIDVEDTSSVIMELDGGIQATYTQCHFSPDYWRNFTFIGTEGRMENMDDSDNVTVKFRSRSKRPMNLLGTAACELQPAEGGHGGADPVITEDFLDMLTKGKKPVATPLAGRMSVAVGCAAAESIRKGGGTIGIPALPEHLQAKVF